MGGLNALLILWLSLSLTAYAAFCLSIAFKGITEEAPLELRVVWWTGRALVAVASVALWLAVSKGLIELALWVTR